MNPRDPLITAFLDRAGWGAAQIAPLAGDASNRRYLRLLRDGQPAVLMDAPPEKGEDVRPFIRIDHYLLEAGLSAPRILAADEVGGFLLLEDLGDAIFARRIEADPPCEEPLYEAAVDVLAALHSHALPDDLAAYDAATMGPLAALAIDWYHAGATGAASPDLSARLGDIVTGLCQAFADAPPVTVLRDYHAENLIWLPGRAGVAQVGLLDFQDAMAGHPAYDLVSLLQDARRDVPSPLARRMRARFLAATGHDAERFDTAYAVLGAQRSLRILGVFARLCLRDGKAHYVDLIPRVWRALNENLAHAALEPLAKFVAKTLPEPDETLLKTLKLQCR